MGYQASVRRFAISDLHTVAQLFDEYRQFYEQDSDLIHAEQFIRARAENDESLILVAENDSGKLDGFCQLYPTFCSVLAKPIYVLSDLFVTSSARRQGIAKKLMDAAQDQGKVDGKARVDLTTAKSNLKAQALYESQGWTRDNAYYTYNFDVKN
jgi:ribosomal protein S18 acetylase RimI-like enzyme